MTNSIVNVLHTAQNILTMAISAGVRHQLHEDAQAVWQGGHGVQAKEDGEVEPLPYVRQDIVLGGAGKAKTL
jgi:hypothetical protein